MTGHGRPQPTPCAFAAGMLGPAMDVRLLLLPALIAAPAALIFAATWGATALAQRAARCVAARPHFTAEERSRLRALRERYLRQPHRHATLRRQREQGRDVADSGRHQYNVTSTRMPASMRPTRVGISK